MIIVIMADVLESITCLSVGLNRLEAIIESSSNPKMHPPTLRIRIEMLGIHCATLLVIQTCTLV